MNCRKLSRRKFLNLSAGALAASPCLMYRASGEFARPLTSIISAQAVPSVANAQVAIVPCYQYGSGVYPAMKKMLGLLGGIKRLVNNKTVTVKLNLTTTNFTYYLRRPVGETFMTHPDTALALLQLLFEAGAKRVRFVESTIRNETLEESLARGKWDLRAFKAAGKKVEFENTRNLGLGKRYSHLKVPDGGHIFSYFELNHSYEETDVLISLCKLKDHITAGVTLTMKNLFGITPNSLYGGQAGSERALQGRVPLHFLPKYDHLELPGIIPEQRKNGDSGYTVPHIIRDIILARPIHLGIIDGITAMSGAENPGPGLKDSLNQFTAPGIMIAGFNPVSTDAVGMACMGYDNPRAERGSWPFEKCDNHILMAEQAGLGTADLDQIEVRGMSIDEAMFPY